jgi:hypothetical protein
MQISHSRTALSFLTILLFSLALFGQDLDDVTIAGRIVDANKQAVAGATVTVTSVDSGAARVATTDDNGAYRFIKLKPGVYKVKAAATGFGPQETAELTTLSGQNLQFDFALSPAGLTAEQTVTVSEDDGPPVDTSRIVVGSTVTEREVEELPNNSRNPLDLVLTLGGTSEEALSTSDLAEDRNSNARSTPLEQGNFSLSGGAAYSNNITIDGLDNNDDRGARDRFQPSLEAISEVQVIRNQFSAEYGRASGGRVNIRTRSGTNKYRGRAFMFFRDARVNANSWYNNANDYERVPFTEYNPGFTFGGPVVLPYLYDGHNRTFFFAAYEYDLFKDTTFVDTYIPVVGNPRFELPPPTGTDQYCDASGSAPPPCASGVGAVSPYSVYLDTPNRSHIVTARIDHRLFHGNDLTFGWQMGRKKNRRTNTASTTRVEDALQAKNIDTDAFNITDNHVFGSRAVNQARFQYSVYEPAYVTDNPLDPVVLIGYRNPKAGVQTLIAGNSTSSSLQNFADSRKETRYQIQDSVSYVFGTHTFKFGADVQHVDSKATSLGDATGTYNFNSVFNYSNNTLSRYRQNFGTASDVVNTYYGAFLNDEFKPARNLTLSYGVRYERETAVSDNNNWGPRLGIAWDPFNKGKGVIRFGTGIFYNRVLLRTVGDFIQNDLGGLQSFDSNTITTANNARNNVLGQIAADFPNGYASIDALKAAIARANCGTTAAPVSCGPNTGFLTNGGSSSNPLRSVDANLKIPESYQFNVGFEREVAKGYVFEANYTWNKTANLWREYNRNAPLVPTGYADLTAWLVDHPLTFTNGTITRTYQFYRGNTDDPTGVATSQNGTTSCSASSNVTCYVNLNSINSSNTSPSFSAGGVGTNSIGSPVGIAIEAVRNLRPVDTRFDEMERVASIGNAFYQGLTLEFRRNFRKLGGGFRSSFRAVYTLSKMMDDGLNNTTNGEVNADFAAEWARAQQDRRHRFAFTATIETPSWLGKVRLSPLFRYGSSAPFNLGIGVDRNLNDVSTDRVIYTGNLDDLQWRRPGSGSVSEAFVSQFKLQPVGAKGGDLQRNAGRGPSMHIFDLSVTREWKFGERYHFRPTVEFGNILNSAVFSYGAEFIDFVGKPAETATPAQKTAYQLFLSNYLVPTRTYRPRQIRFGMRFDF